MTDLPQIDPNWTRPPRPQPKDGYFLGPLLITLIVVCSAIWLGHTHTQFENARNAATVRSQVLAAQAPRRQEEALTLAEYKAKYATEVGGERQTPEAARRAPDNRIHRCVSRSTDTYQLGPCRAPLVEVGYAPVDSRQESATQQARMQQDAEARLRAEQQRFAELTGQSGRAWQSGSSPNASDSPRQRCASMKAARDEAYRVAGNNRTFDFIRRWDDAVYEACKNT